MARQTRPCRRQSRSPDCTAKRSLLRRAAPRRDSLRDLAACCRAASAIQSNASEANSSAARPQHATSARCCSKQEISASRRRSRVIRRAGRSSQRHFLLTRGLTVREACPNAQTLRSLPQDHDHHPAASRLDLAPAGAARHSCSIARVETMLTFGREMIVGCLVIVGTGWRGDFIVSSYSTCSSEAAIGAGRPRAGSGG